MHNPELTLENETHKILWDSEIQTAHLILARRPDIVIVKKKMMLHTMRNEGLKDYNTWL